MGKLTAIKESPAEAFGPTPHQSIGRFAGYDDFIILPFERGNY
jgi:hypothetical protein